LPGSAVYIEDGDRHFVSFRAGKKNAQYLLRESAWRRGRRGSGAGPPEWAEGGGILCELVVGHHFPSRKNDSRDCLRRAVRQQDRRQHSQPAAVSITESEIAKAPDLSSGGGGHGGVLGFSPHPRRYDETMASKWVRRTGNRHFRY
jgi:hypothetical protein